MILLLSIDKVTGLISLWDDVHARIRGTLPSERFVDLELTDSQVRHIKGHE
jgi:hypothetical protein